MTEEPTKCPKCGEMSVYDYNGMPICENCYYESMNEDDPRTIEEVIGNELTHDKEQRS